MCVYIQQVKSFLIHSWKRRQLHYLCVTNQTWFICIFLLKGCYEYKMLLLSLPLGVRVTSCLSLEMAQGGIFLKRWLISVKTLHLSVTCVTKHLKSLQLSWEVPTALLKWSDETICGRSLTVLRRGICPTLQLSHVWSHLRWNLVSLIQQHEASHCTFMLIMTEVRMKLTSTSIAIAKITISQWRLLTLSWYGISGNSGINSL